MKRGEFGVLLCWHPDRLYRSMRDLERVIDVADERGVQLRTVDCRRPKPLARLPGGCSRAFWASVARQEVEHKGERQRAR